MDFLAVSAVNKKGKDNYIIQDISFIQRPLEKIVIAGETGSGKTSLLKMIGGHLQMDSGEIFFEGERVKGPNERLIPGHPYIAYLSQHFELRNNYWVHEILEYANELTLQSASDIYDVCRIRHLLKRRTDQLSGGERQRIALAKLLTGRPKLLLLDEPFSNLDAIHKNDIKTVIKDVGEKLGITSIIVSHDPLDILSWADTVMILQNGMLIQKDRPENVYRHPVNEYVAGLFGPYSVFDKGNGQPILLRPEQIKLSGDTNGIAATVQRVNFLGPYYLIEVLCNGQLLQVQSNSNNFSTGGKVFIEIASYK